MSKKQSLTMRSLHYYWLATRNHLGPVSYTHLTLPTIA